MYTRPVLSLLLRLLLASWLLVELAGPAQAKDSVAILPMTSSSKSLEIYGHATSATLARRLAAKSKVTVVAVQSSAEVPADSNLIIDGRLVGTRGKRVQLEARLRRVSNGKSVATVATRSAKVTQLDSLVESLARKLEPLVDKALKQRTPIELPAAIIAGEAATAKKAQWPDVVVVPATGRAARGAVEVRTPATVSAFEFVARLGLRAVASRSLEGVVSPGPTMTLLNRFHAKYALMLDVKKVTFAYNGVLSARGSVRVLLVNQAGQAIVDRIIDTGTVVGARGDRHQALVYFVTEQALDTALPEFRKVFAR